MPSYTRHIFNGPANSGLTTSIGIRGPGFGGNPEQGIKEGELLHTCPSGAIDNCYFRGGTANVHLYMSGSFNPWDSVTPQALYTWTLGSASNGFAPEVPSVVVLTEGQSIHVAYSAADTTLQKFIGWVDRITGQ